jgi:hypothetical protein
MVLHYCLQKPKRSLTISTSGTIWKQLSYSWLCTCISWRKWWVKPGFTVHQTSHLYYRDELKWQNLKVCLLLHVSCALKLNTWFIITNKMIKSDTNYWMETIIFSVSHNWGTTKVKFVKLELNSVILTPHCNTNGGFGAW